MIEPKQPKELIVDTLIDKSDAQRAAFANTQKALSEIKTVLQAVVKDYNMTFAAKNHPNMMEYKDRSAHDAELVLGPDLLLFTLSSNVFDFDKTHSMWKTSYVQKNPMSSFCGVINVYNFLADSFKYQRNEDVGYLIARIFINKDNHFFVEGKRQLGFLYNDFMNVFATPEMMRNVVESAMLFTLDFDLIVPEYEQVSMITVEALTEQLNNAKVSSSKRLGFRFSTE